MVKIKPENKQDEEKEKKIQSQPVIISGRLSEQQIKMKGLKKYLKDIRLKEVEFQVHFCVSI